MMTIPQASLQTVYQDNQSKLKFAWSAGHEGALRVLQQNAIKRYKLPLVGHLNFVHPNAVQVLGTIEIAYYQQHEAESLKQLQHQHEVGSLQALVVTNAETPPSGLVAFCQQYAIPLWLSPEHSTYVMDVLRLYLAKALADSTSLHGVFMDVLEVGVLITGDSGMGKSELALELISRGHGIVADDMVEIHRIGPTFLEGRCPAVLRDFLEVRGLGLLNIRTIFGETAVRPKMNLKLIIHLVKASADNMVQVDRLQMDQATQDVLGVAVRKVTLPVAAGRNLAVLVEAAVRNHILLLRGIDSAKEFIERHQKLMQEE